MPVSDILLFEGIRGRGGKSVGKKCSRRKRVFSSKLGRNVLRCAEFGGSSGLGAMPIEFDQVKDTLLTGGLAIGGAVVMNKAVGYLAPYININPADPKHEKWIAALEIIGGVGAGWAVGKYGGKPEIGAAIAIGPVVVNGLKLVGWIITPAESTPIAGAYAYNQPAYQPGLGVPISQEEFPPDWISEHPAMNQVAEQYPAWAM